MIDRNLPVLPLSTLWIRPTSPQLERVCNQSWLDAVSNTEFYCYEKVADVTFGYNQLDGARTLEHSQVLRNEPNQSEYAVTPNLFRYRLLSNREDAVWIGADVYAGSRQLQFSDYILAGANRFFTTVAVLRALSNSKFLELCEKRSRTNLDLVFAGKNYGLFS